MSTTTIPKAATVSAATRATTKKDTPPPEERKPTLRSTITREHIEGLSEDGDAHKKFNEKRTIDKLHVDIRGKSARVMHLTELLYGHKDADIDFAERALSHLEALPPKERPDVIVASGLIYGAYTHREKNNRRTRTMTASEQFAKAKEFIERLQKMGMTVVYNKSDNDQKIIEDYTYDAVKTIQGIVRERGDDWPTSFASFDRIKQSPLWQSNYEFQWDVVFEYMLRSGRNLLTKEEVFEKSEGEEEIEEYLLLMDAHRRLEAGERLTPLQRTVLEVQNIPHTRRDQDKLIVTDDYNLELETSGKTTNLRGFHELKQTSTSMTKDPTRVPRLVVSQLEASGRDTPDALVVENQQRGMGVMLGKTLIMSTPGMTTYNFDSSSFARVSSDKAERMAKSRGELNIAGVQEVEFHDDGRISIHLMNDVLMNIAAKTSEPHAAIFFSDWQVGSTTARPDLAVKALDYALHSVLTKQQGMMFVNGDIIHGANYPNMPRECANMGLVNIDDQQVFVDRMLREILEKMPKGARENLQGVHITPGNHEWNSGNKFYGTNHSVFLKSAFGSASENSYPTVLHSNDIMRSGTSHFKSNTAIAELAEHKVLAQHYMLENGSGVPINQFAQLLSSSAGPLMKDINLMGAGHWHHPQYMMSSNKIGFISGSLAGLGGYEWWKGINPVIGTTIVHLGGNRPPRIEFLTPEFLYNYKCKGAFSDANLERQGFTTDRSFDPNLHGFGKILIANGNQIQQMPQSAIQKKLWKIVEEIQWGSSVALS
jgi:hypothetical protein